MPDIGNTPRERTIQEKLRCLEEKLFRISNDLSSLNSRMTGRAQEKEVDANPEKPDISGSLGEAHRLTDRLNKIADSIGNEVFNLKSAADTIREDNEISEDSGCCKTPSCG